MEEYLGIEKNEKSREAQSGEMAQAKAVLHVARAYYAGAMLAARHQPNDLQVHHRLQEAVEQGKNAWKEFQMAATTRQASQAAQSVPSEFQQ